MSSTAAHSLVSGRTAFRAPAPTDAACRDADRARDGRYPLSRWYLRPVAGWLARMLAPTRVRPWQVSVTGLVCAAAATAIIVGQPAMCPAASVLVLLAWFCDRTDGPLARRQGTASAFGAWLDANLDELADVGLHVAAAVAAAGTTQSQWPWGFLVAFLAGKYLFMHGLAHEDQLRATRRDKGDAVPAERVGASRSWLRWAYHLPGNSDVRIHLLAAALASGWLTAELGFVACYYNARWVARYVLVGRRLRGEPT